MKTNKNEEKTVTALEYRLLRQEHPLLLVQWEGIGAPTEGETNVIMHQDFMNRVRVRVDHEQNLIFIIPTRHQIGCIEDSRLVKNFSRRVGTLIRVVRNFGLPPFPVSEKAHRAALSSAFRIPARF